MTITIHVADKDDAPWACRLVAERIEEGCVCGCLGVGNEEWNLVE